MSANGGTYIFLELKQCTTQRYSFYKNKLNDEVLTKIVAVNILSFKDVLIPFFLFLEADSDT